MTGQGKVLIIDDEESMRIACRQTLEMAGYSTVTAENGEYGLERSRQESFDVALLDLRMPGLPGIEVLKKLRQESPNTAVIIITGHGSIESAVQAIKLGAYDYLPKPFTPEALIAQVRRAETAARRALENACVGEGLERKMLSKVLIGRSEAMSHVLRLVQKAAPADSTVLITGETGVGKEVVARAIHRLSRRANQRFVTVDCGTLVETLFESELFGHVKGAFSGAIENTTGKLELADRGTLFLDEIANISAYNVVGNGVLRYIISISDRRIAIVVIAEKLRDDEHNANKNQQPNNERAFAQAERFFLVLRGSLYRLRVHALSFACNMRNSRSPDAVSIPSIVCDIVAFRMRQMAQTAGGFSYR